MKVAKLTTWDGREFYTDDLDAGNLQNFWSNIKNGYTQEQLNEFELEKAQATAEIIEMTTEEYMAIPATEESRAVFG